MDLSLTDARRLALRAQGFGTRRPGRVTQAHLRRQIGALGAVQIDAVNVLVRSQYLPLFSRLGAYDRAALDRLAYCKGDAFEQWAHAASLVPTALHHAMRWRMEDHASTPWWVTSQRAVEARNPGYLKRVVDEITDRGPLSFNQLADPARRTRGPSKYAESTLLWDARPSDGKHVLEGLWLEGRLAVAGRGPGFERVFDLAERVIPAAELAKPTPSRSDAQRVLVDVAARALGVSWVKDLADYFRLPVADTKARVRELVESGELVAVKVEGISEIGYAQPGAKPKPVEARALLSPFDSLLWERARNVRVFGFRHSFEIYVPEAKRQYGYFVLPFLLDESLVARVDVKADRAGSTLLVHGSFAEPGASPKVVAGPLAAELFTLARWLGLDRVKVADRGDLAPLLRRAIPRSGAAQSDISH